MPTKHHGFTLVEVMVTLVVAAILISIAVPSYKSFVANNRLATSANELMAALNYARSEAISRHEKVSVCARKKDSDDQCGDDWFDGWLVYVGSNGDIKQPKGVLRVHTALNSNTLKIEKDTTNQDITFSDRGFNVKGGTVGLKTNKRKACIVVASTGRTRVDSSDDCDA